MYQRTSLDLGPLPRKFLAILLIVLAVGCGLRLYQALTPEAYISEDETSYRGLAARMYERGVLTCGYPDTGFAHPERWPPGMPVFIATSYAAVGKISPTAGRIGQVIVGTLLILAVYLLATRLARRREAGLVAAGLTAIYPPLVNTAGSLLSEPLGTLFLVASVLALVMLIDQPSDSPRGRIALLAVASGALLGLAVLTRTDYLFLLLFLLPIVVWACRGQGRFKGLGRGLLLAAVVALAFVLILTPWSACNSTRKNRLVPVTTGGATPLFIGTYLPGDGTRSGVKEALRDEAAKIHPSIRGERTFRIRARFIMDAVARRQPHLDRDRAISKEAKLNFRRYAAKEPVAFTGMMLRKVPKMWTRPFDGGRYPASTVPRLIHLAYLLFGLTGLVLLLWRPERRLVAALLAAVVAYGTALHLLVVAFPRYNLPLMPLLISAGAAGLYVALIKLGQTRT